MSPVITRVIPVGVLFVAAVAPLCGQAPAADEEIIMSAAVSADGKLLAAAGAGRAIRLWSVQTGKEVRQLEHPRGVVALTFNATGQVLASAGGDRTIRVWDVATGKEQHRFKLESEGVLAVAISPDGTILAAAKKNIELFDLTTGKLIRRLDGHPEATPALAFAPDGQTLASGGTNHAIRLWDVAKGTMLRELAQPHGVACLAYSPNGKTLASGAVDGTIVLWDPDNATQRRKLAGERGWPCCSLTFSTDGKTLAAGAGAGPSDIHRWNVETGDSLKPLPGFRGAVVPIAFTAGSHSLAATDGDPLALLWDIAAAGKDRPPARINLTQDELDSLWEYLAGDDASLAFEAVDTLTRDPARALPYCRRHIRPEPPFPPVAQLIADLDADKFQVRQEATEMLQRLGKGAEPALRETLKKKPPLEVTRRIEDILERIESGRALPEQRRLSRAIEVFRLCGTPEAREALQLLASGTSESWLTQEAKAALAKMPKR